MTSFKIHFETRITEEICIEAESAEEAARIALSDYTKPKERTVRMRPTWMETRKKEQQTGELSMEIMGLCCRCGEGVINQHGDEPHPRGWPWSWATLDDHGEKLCCYACYQAPLKQLADAAE